MALLFFQWHYLRLVEYTYSTESRFTLLHSMLLRYTLTQVVSITTEISLTQPSPSYRSPNTDKPDICLHSFIISVLCNIWNTTERDRWKLLLSFIPATEISSGYHSINSSCLVFFPVKWASFCRVVLGSQSNWAKGTDSCLLTYAAALTSTYDWMEDFLQPVFLHWPILPHKFIFYLRVQP